MSESTLKVAVIGCGYLGRFHAQKYAALQQSELVAVCDPSMPRASAVATETHSMAYSHYQDCLPHVDAVSIVCTTSAHYRVALDCLKAGKHVLLEKPITETLSQADELIAAAEAANVKLQIGHLERYNPVMQSIAPLLKEPRFIDARRLAPFKKRCCDVNVILDLMIHDIELVLSIVNSPLTQIEATGESILSNHVDCANARLTFESGCVANLTASRIHHRVERQFFIAQTGESFECDLQNRRYRRSQLIESEEKSVKHSTHRLNQTDALLQEITDFIESIETNRTPLVSGTAGRNALKIAIQISQHIAEHTLATHEVA